MSPRIGHHRMLCAVAAIMIAGCHSYGPYSPYQSYPGYYMPPAGAVPAQGTTYAPPGGGTFQPTPVNPNDPQLGPSSTFPEAANEQWRQADGQSGSGGGNPNTFYDDFDGGDPVPDYRTDDRPVTPDSGSAAAGGSASSPFDDSFGANDKFQPDEAPGSLFDEQPATGSPTGRPLEADSSADEFRRPRDNGNDRRSFESNDSPFGSDPAGGNPVDDLEPFSVIPQRGQSGQGGPVLTQHQQPQSAGFQTAVSPAPQRRTVARTSATTAPSSNPFAYDASQYRWLRGVVAYDQASNSWQMVYSASPETDDKLGGSVTLVPDQRLKSLRNNEVVLIKGQVDNSSRDQFGKPRYRVQQISRVTVNAN